MPNVAADFARLCAADYADTLPVLYRLDIAGITSTLTPFGDDVVMVIRGTDAARDWTDWDLRAFPVTQQGDTRHWHAGILSYSRVCYSFARGWMYAGGKLDLIVGHSLGAGAGQIIGPSLGIRTICFASPRPLYSDLMPVGAELVENYCASDDAICNVPPMGNHVGSVIKHAAVPRRNPLVAHAVLSYAELLEGLT
jgi:hypothetical protein